MKDLMSLTRPQTYRSARESSKLTHGGARATICFSLTVTKERRSQGGTGRPICTERAAKIIFVRRGVCRNTTRCITASRGAGKKMAQTIITEAKCACTGITCNRRCRSRKKSGSAQNTVTPMTSATIIRPQRTGTKMNRTERLYPYCLRRKDCLIQLILNNFNRICNPS